MNGRFNVEEFALHVGVPCDDLRRFSIEENSEYWHQVASRLGPPWQPEFDAVLVRRSPTEVDWFVGGMTNLTSWCFREDLPGEDVVLRWISERDESFELSRGGLRIFVSFVSESLRQLDIGPGSRVAIVGGLHWEVASVVLGILAVGATCMPVFSGYGATALEERLRLGKPDAVILQDGTIRRGRDYSIAANALPIVKNAVPARTPVILLDTGFGNRLPVSGIETWRLSDVRSEQKVISPLAVKSEDTAFVLFTSGSTGYPKEVSLSHGGFGVQIASEWQLHLDVRLGDDVVWPADMGWMVGPWSLVGVLGGGGCLTLVDGSPIETLIANVEKISHATIIGGSPTFLSGVLSNELLSERLTPRIIGTAGEPLTSQIWRDVHIKLGREQSPIINLCGGTEVGGSLLASLPIDNAVPGGFGGSALGMDLNVLDDSGKSSLNVAGHLVCRNDWPGRATAVVSRTATIKNYFDRFGVWEQGDLALRTDENDWFILGRSDDVMKVRGRRLGPSEVEEAATSVSGVRACVSTAVDLSGHSSLICVVLCDREHLDESPSAVASAVEKSLGSPFRPIWVGAVSEMPLLSSGKIDRRKVQSLLAVIATSTDSESEAIRALEDQLLVQLSEECHKTNLDNSVLNAKKN
jgi:acetyl-CoA synthetase